MIACESCHGPFEATAVRCPHCGYERTVTAGPTRTYTGTDSVRPADDDLPRDDDSGRVERLLAHIAGQSHFEERYILRGEVARGGMGQILRGYDQILRREVAVKMMHERYGATATGAAVRGQFLKEARVGGRVLHPNILPVFDLGVNRAGQIYYTMRLVDGASLQHCLDAVDKGVVTRLIAYPLRRVVEAFTAVCHGVDYAHQRGVIHLDLKPSNVLVSGFNEVFVIDWGLARVDDTDDTEALVDLYRGGGDDHSPADTGAFEGRIVGTPSYMSPEQSRGQVTRFDAATDVYGLGGVLHFILYGTAPNRGSGIEEVMAASAERKTRGKLRSGILPRGQRVRREAREAVETLERICLKALEPERSARYATVEELIVELGEWLAQTPGLPIGF